MPSGRASAHGLGHKDQWSPDAWEVPLHVTPHSMQHLHAYSMVDNSVVQGSFGLRDLHHPDSNLGAQLMQDSAGTSVQAGHGDRSFLEPRRVGVSASEAERKANLESFGASTLQSPMRVTRSMGMTEQARAEHGAWMDDRQRQYSPAEAPEKLQEEAKLQDVQQNQRNARMVQYVQMVTAQQGLPPDGEFFQQTMAELAKLMPGFEGWGDAPGTADSSVQGTAGENWCKNLAAGCATAAATKVDQEQGGVPPARSSSKLAPSDETVPKDADQRVEELNRYIRQQAHEYIEGQAEWCRQIAEVRSESQREVEKVRREKGEVERQARQELLRLQHRIRELGGGEEDLTIFCKPTSTAEEQPVAPWANVVGMDEFQELQGRCNASEDRLQELQLYIKANNISAGVAADVDQQKLMEEKDAQVQGLQQALLQLGQDLQQVAADVHALRFHHEHKVAFWEQGAKRLLAMAEQFFCQNGLRGLPLGGGAGQNGCVHAEEEDDGGRFGKTATKLLVTLSPSGDKDGGDTGSLQRLLKDALKNGPKDKGSKRTPTASKEEEREDKAQATPPSSVGTSRETSPGRAAASPRSCAGTVTQVVRENGTKQAGDGCTEEAPAMSETARVAHFIAQLATDLRHLLSVSNQAVVPSPSAASLAAMPTEGAKPGADSSAEWTSSPGTGLLIPTERTEKLRQVLEGLAPARRGAAQHIVAVERILRNLHQELRLHCEELLCTSDEPQADATDEGVVAQAQAEAREKLPLAANDQLQSLMGLRRAHLRSTQALAEFVQLPLKLKTVFDLTKTLTTEVESYFPCSAMPQMVRAPA
eukprot:CAMPEP_0197638080 /NCGR_PEP_ID=MMETSP1338-20131121/13101_1 /TAXON_ID=43686 ORGANISM="Pelagodinium beii, Strain RCC1491" /NCGR_SAMPLE_ID=MMETSP1338 /ASSEMBLY_ACC=CAM_ASM_000754 /LENGTH=816 /DNA_ID=CAMNT_0043210595 /DNA_START=215 /DNA_END=2665 /DNA_ORIENTATION=-